MGKPRHLYLLPAWLAAGTITALSAFISWKEWRTGRELAEASVLNVAHILAHQVENSLDHADALLASIRTGIPVALRSDGSLDPAFVERLRQEVPYHPLVARAGFLDARGRLVFTTGPVPEPADFSTREYFRRAKGGETGRIFTGPLKAAARDEWILVLARRVAGVDGTFRGVVFAALPVQSIGKAFAGIDLGPSGVVNLRTLDFAQVVRYPSLAGEQRDIGNRTVSRTIQELMARHPGRSEYVYRTVAPIDGVERIYTYRKFEHSPFWMTVGRATAEFSGAWRQTAALLAGLSMAMSGLLLWGARRLEQQNRSLAGRIEEEARAKLRAESSDAQFRTLFAAGPAMTALTDLGTGELLEVNDAFCEATGYTRGECLGANVHQLGLVDAPKRARLLQALAGPGLVRNLPHSLRVKDGRRLETLYSGGILSLDGRMVILSMFLDVSELRLAEAAVHLAEERFRQVSEAAQEWIWEVDAEGTYTYASPAVTQLLGYAPEDLVGRLRFHDLWPPESRGRILERALRIIAARESFRDFPNVCRHRSGQDVHLETTGLPILGTNGQLRGYRGVDRDVSEREQAHQSLRESESRFRQLFEHSPVAVWEDDFSAVEARFRELRAAGVGDLRRYLDGHPELAGELARQVRVVAANEATLALLGVARREDLPAGMGEVFPPEALDGFAGLLAALYAGETRQEFETVLLDRAGRRRMVLARLSVLPGHAFDLARVLVSVVDLTELKEAEAERQRLERELGHLHRLDSLGQMAAGLSHDMNNVLGSIMGVASALQLRHPDDPVLVREAEVLLQSAVRGRDLVRGLRDFSRKELDSAGEVDLNELARQEADLVDRTTFKKVQVRLDLAPGLPPVRGDASAIANALMNVCANAVDAMPRGGTLALATRDLGQGFVELEVTDTGDGMEPQVLARAMEPFFTTKPVGRGTGLGLSQVYGTMKAHGGTLVLASEPGQGTRASLTFPTSDGAAGAAPPPEPAEEPPEPAGSRGLAVLLVDDEDLFREASRFLLESLGHRVTEVRAAQEALDRLRAGDPVDLLVLDLNMPGMDGSEALLRVRELRPGLAVLLCTGFPDERVPELLKRYAGVRLLGKPFSLGDLRRVLAGWP